MGGAIRLNQFAGELPAVHADKLPQQNAQLAQNTRLLSGALESWHGPGFSRGLALTGPRTIFLTQYGSWVESYSRRSIVNSIYSSDPHNRIFFTGEDITPSVSDYGQVAGSATPAYNRLGVPVPEEVTGTVISIGGSGDDPGESDDKRTVYYVVTFVNEFGEEGPPCAPAGPFEIAVDETVELDLPRINQFDNPDNVSFDGNQVPLVEYYVYRSLGGSFRYIASVGASSGSFTDAVDFGAEAEPIESQEWYPPPDNLAGMTVVAGGFLAAYRRATQPGEPNASAGNEVLFSESNLPHAWPTAYRLPVNYEVVALGSFGQTLVVLTKGSVFMGRGADPAAIALTNTNIQQPCVAEGSVVSLQGGVVYASPDGLVYVTDQGPQLTTESVLTRREWDRYSPETIRAARWYHLYVAFYDGEDGPGAFTFDPRSPEDGIVHFDTPYPSAVFTDLEEDRLYFVDGQDLKEWNAGSRLFYRWRSRSISLVRPTPIGVARIWADQYPVSIHLYRDSVLQDTVQVESLRPVRLRNATLGRDYEVEIETENTVYDVAFGTSMADLLEA